MTQPLSDLLVLDMTRVIAGPLATQTLGDFGATIIKIERRGQGDDVRKVGPPWMPDKNGNESEESTYFQSVNRNKRSLTIDFTKPEGAELLRKIAEKADVLCENYRPGTLAKYGLSYEDIKAINPRVIYCSITGFGQTGPYAERSAYDLLIQGMGGVMSVTGIADDLPGSEPMRVGIPLADIFSGLNATIGILTALRHRDATGEGQFIDISLFESQVAAMLNPFSAWVNSRVKIRRTGNEQPSAAPYGVYHASDGYLLVTTSNDREFERLAKALDRAEWLDDPRFAKSGARVANRAVLREALNELLKHKTRSEWVELLTTAVVPCGPINDMRDIENDPQMLARDAIASMPSPLSTRVTFPASPIRLSKTPVEYHYPPPLPGGDTDEILKEVLGLNAQDIADLRKRDII